MAYLLFPGPPEGKANSPLDACDKSVTHNLPMIGVFSASEVEQELCNSTSVKNLGIQPSAIERAGHFGVRECFPSQPFLSPL